MLAVFIVADDPLTIEVALSLLVGWSFLASGCVAWTRRPDNDLGALMVVTALVWFASRLLRAWMQPLPLTAGVWLGDVWLIPLTYLLMSFPLGRPDGRADRVILAAVLVVMLPLELAWLMFLDFHDVGPPDLPQNILLVADDPGLAKLVDNIQDTILIAALAALTTLLLRRYRRASPPLRRVLAPVLVGAGGIGLLTFVLVLEKLSVDAPWLFEVNLALMAAVPIVFLIGVLRARLARSAIGDLLVDLHEPAAPGALRDALARALRDPTLELAYWVPEYETYVGTDGKPAALPTDAHRQTTFVERNGAPVAALIHDASLADEPQLVGAVTSAAGIALENERLQADLRARLADLRASRARIVEAGDTARRRLERDLHDGAQQRLVSLSVLLRVIAGRLPDDPVVETARAELTASLDELRSLASGIHPAILTDHGLAVALETVAARAPVKVTLDIDLADRPPPAVEVAAYYLVTEGLTNVAKYAEAERASVTIRRDANTLTVELVDDGRGGADPSHGSGLRGLADRVEALGGRLRVWSPSGGGTTLRAEIPCA